MENDPTFLPEWDSPEIMEQVRSEQSTATVDDLAGLDTRDFIANIRPYPLPGQWASAETFRYVALRLARIQGLVIKK